MPHRGPHGTVHVVRAGRVAGLEHGPAAAGGDCIRHPLAAGPVLIEQDFTALDAPHVIADAALGRLGAVDILVNNAGGSRKFSLESSDDDWEEAMTLNFTRLRQLTQALLPGMIERRWGRIVNITGKSEPDRINAEMAVEAPIFGRH